MQQVGLFKACLVKIRISLGILDINLKHITHIVPLLGSRSSEAVDPQGGRVLLRPPSRARASGHALVPRRRRFLSARYDFCKPKYISENLSRSESSFDRRVLLRQHGRQQPGLPGGPLRVPEEGAPGQEERGVLDGRFSGLSSLVL